MVLFNSTKPPFNNLLLREALSYATDAKAIRDKVFAGFYPSTQTFCTNQTLFCPTQVSTYHGYNPTKARQLISEYQTQTGKPFPTIPLYSFLSTNVILTEAIAAQWKAVGVNVNITVAPSIGTYFGDVRANTWPNWVENSVLASTDPATGTFAMFGVNGEFTGTNDQTLQSMLSRAESIVTPTVREGLYKQIFSYINQMAYGIPIYQSSILTVNAKNVVGYVDGVSKQIVQDTDIWLK
jgi:ABC-type transport system substrate-binding protein